MERSKINVCDEAGNVIGVKYRDEIDYTKDIYMSTGLWITNSKNQVLIAQRKLTKDKDPGLWGPAVAGTVDEGETFETNIYKEAEEEIGLTGVVFEKGPSQRMTTPRRYFGQWYLAKVDKPIEHFIPQEEEVEKLTWVDEYELVGDLKNYPEKYVPALSKIIDELTEANNKLG